MTSDAGLDATNSFDVETDSREKVNSVVRSILPGANVLIELFNGSTKRLTVETSTAPDWTSRSVIDGYEEAKTLKGYGTSYLLVGHIENDHKYSPILTWPSKSPMATYVFAITVEEPAKTQIVTDETSEDLLWRVSRYNGI